MTQEQARQEAERRVEEFLRLEDETTFYWNACFDRRMFDDEVFEHAQKCSIIVINKEIELKWMEYFSEGYDKGVEDTEKTLYSEEEVREMLFEALNHKKEECCVTHTIDSIVRKVIKEFKKK